MQQGRSLAPHTRELLKWEIHRTQIVIFSIEEFWILGFHGYEFRRLHLVASMRRTGQFRFPEALLLLISWLFRLGAVSPVTEKEILLQFKGNISDDPYSSLGSWVPAGDPCRDFGGVVCNSAGEVDKIVLWNTSLAGAFPSALSGLRSVRVFTFFGNRFSGNIPPEFIELQSLWKINVSTNLLSGEIPDFLGDLPNLRLLDLSRNSFSGQIPASLFNHCHKTKFVSLSHNNLTGSIPSSMANCTDLEGFDFSSNSLTGDIPSTICNIPRLNYLSLRNNALTGTVDQQISKCQSLELFDLGTNLLSGFVPFQVLGFKNLSYFNLSNNGFVGEMPEIASCGEKLEKIDLSGNSLDGEISGSIRKCERLEVLDLGINLLSGSIPVEIADLKNILVMRLSNNSIGGSIPPEFGRIELLQVLDLKNLNLVGPIPDDIGDCRFLLELDVSGNALDGEIPQTLYNMTYLEILDLHQNRLNGSIPSSLGNLSNLQLLDLSQNSLSAPIPPSLGNLTSLTHLNFSSNNLSGTIPPSLTLQASGPTAFSNNPNLCGAPLPSCSRNANPKSSESDKTKQLSVSVIIAIIAAAVILTGICLVTVMSTRARKRTNKENLEMVCESTTESNVIIGKLVLFSKTLPSKYEDWESGTKALLDKDSVIGAGSIGTVYKATFECGISIAVKKLNTLGRFTSQDEFEHEITRLGNIIHQNLVSFQGYYWSASMQLILSEFIANGNLFDNLHGLNSPIRWSTRFHIALGTARSLAYLHHDCKPPILHLNVKSSNILLDEGHDAKLSDFGLMKLLPVLDNYGVTKIHASVGYVAPELSQGSRASEKSDVYSFGVVLLELVTGRRPVERPSGDEVVVLGEYVRVLVESGDACGCFDARLRGFVENEVVGVMRLGLICTCEVASRRPSMAEVVQVLESIRGGQES